jgi:hypothetical protein
MKNSFQQNCIGYFIPLPEVISTFMPIGRPAFSGKYRKNLQASGVGSIERFAVPDGTGEVI